MSKNSLPVLIQQMLHPDFYPHPVREAIRLIQTHISYVLLTGDYAYKIKKPVDFGFLDYSTLAKRRHFCEEELRMNQRGAPELYLEVVAIALSDEQFSLGVSGEIIEYALKMRQFPQDALFINLFEQSLLTEKHLEELGKVVAQFHAESPTNDYIRRFGRVEKIRESIDNNYKITLKYIGGVQTQKQFDETRQYTDRFLKNRQEVFTRRIENNWIRECHGDLHLRNIALWNDKILLFDRIEFNEPFRFVDVMYDVAFTVMDLEGRSRQDLANVFLNAYIEQTGDWEGLQILPIYLCRQAYVRAKVTSLLLDDPAVPSDEKEKAYQSAEQYYRLAWEYAQSRRGELILMSGLSGSGKSTVARQLAKRLGAIHIRSDAVRKHLGGIPLNQRGGEALYSAEMTQKTYSRLLELGIMLAKEGWRVILDAKYDRQTLRGEAIAAATSSQLPLQILHCTAPLEVLRDRLQRRSDDIADATADLLAAQIAATEPFSETERVYVTPIDTTQNLESQLEKGKGEGKREKGKGRREKGVRMSPPNS